MDIDGLKSVNDGLGHEVGDAFIREMADVIKASVPKDCLVMRYGGDEFVVFGSCTNAKRMQMIVSKIKNTMEKEKSKRERESTNCLPVSDVPYMHLTRLMI